RNLRRSKSGTSGSAASATTRALNSNQDSSRLTNIAGSSSFSGADATGMSSGKLTDVRQLLRGSVAPLGAFSASAAPVAASGSIRVVLTVATASGYAISGRAQVTSMSATRQGVPPTRLTQRRPQSR